jgi:hypothetical protein
LNTIPDVTGIPLDYIIRDKVEPDIQEDVDYMVGLVLQAPLTGAAFRTDNSKVHRYLNQKETAFFQARLVACGNSQITKVHFQESYAPIINNVTLQKILVVTMLT